jgi:hypothetical protein
MRRIHISIADIITFLTNIITATIIATGNIMNEIADSEVIIIFSLFVSWVFVYFIWSDD